MNVTSFVKFSITIMPLCWCIGWAVVDRSKNCLKYGPGSYTASEAYAHVGPVILKVEWGDD